MITYNSLNTIIDDLLNIIRNSTISQSETISRNQIEYWINQYRAILLKQDIDKNRNVNPDYIQTIPAIQLVPADFAENTTIKTGYYRFRSNIKIPKTVDFHFKSGITWIGDLLNNEIQLIPESRSQWNKYKKYTGDDSIAYISNGYLYIETKQLLDYVKLRGIFEYPKEVAILVNPLTTLVNYTGDEKYPIPVNMLPVLKEMIIKKELAIMVNAPSDKTDDSNNVVTGNAKQEVV